MFIRKFLFAAALAAMVIPGAASAQEEPFVSEIMIVPYTYCPRGWAEANGQLVSIAQNTALFSLIGINYGGNGQTNFALPDLRGRTIVHNGQGPGLSQQAIGQTSGTETFTLTTANLPPHTHNAALRAYAFAANSTDPTGNSIARAGAGKNFFSTVDPNVDMKQGDITISATGSGAPVQNRSPYIAMRHCIALEGAFPPRP